jgi:hypothetical protein
VAGRPSLDGRTVSTLLNRGHPQWATGSPAGGFFVSRSYGSNRQIFPLMKRFFKVTESVVVYGLKQFKNKLAYDLLRISDESLNPQPDLSP